MTRPLAADDCAAIIESLRTLNPKSQAREASVQLRHPPSPLAANDCAAIIESLRQLSTGPLDTGAIRS